MPGQQLDRLLAELEKTNTLMQTLLKSIGQTGITQLGVSQQLQAPVITNLIALNANEIELQFAETGADYYEISIRTEGSTAFLNYGQVATSPTVITGRSANTTYDIRMRAIKNSAGSEQQSAFSAIASIKTLAISGGDDTDTGGGLSPQAASVADALIDPDSYVYGALELATASDPVTTVVPQSGDVVLESTQVPGVALMRAVVRMPANPGRSVYNIGSLSSTPTTAWSELQTKFEEARDNNHGTILFPPSSDIHLVNPGNINGSILPVDGLIDVLVDLNGSTLWADEIAPGPTIEDSARVRFVNGKIRTNHLLATVGRVVVDTRGSSFTGFNLELLPEFVTPLEDAFASSGNNPQLLTVGRAKVDPEGGYMFDAEDSSDIFTNRGGSKDNWTYDTTLKAFKSISESSSDVFPYKEGDLVFMLHRNNAGHGFVLKLGEAGPGQANNGRLDDISFDNIDLINVPGMGFVGEIDQGFLLENCSIDKDRSNALSFWGSSSDGCHLNGGSNVIIRNNNFKGSADDQVTVKANYWAVAELNGNNLIAYNAGIKKYGVNQWGRAGDRVIFIDGQLNVVGETTLAQDTVENKATDLQKAHDVVLTSMPAGVNTTHFIANVDKVQGRIFVIDNLMYNSRAQGIKVQSRYGHIENNGLKNIAGPGLEFNFSLVPDRWYESVFTANYYAGYNTLETCAVARTKSDQAIHLIQNDLFGNDIEVMRNIRFEGNVYLEPGRGGAVTPDETLRIASLPVITNGSSAVDITISATHTIDATPVDIVFKLQRKADAAVLAVKTVSMTGYGTAYALFSASQLQGLPSSGVELVVTAQGTDAMLTARQDATIQVGTVVTGGGDTLPDLGDLTAFPGVKGFGASFTTCRGVPLYRVNNLNDSGPGSLRFGCESNEPRIIVFDTGGIITLDNEITPGSDKIVYGGSAPGKGVCISMNPDAIKTPINIINSRIGMQHLHVRCGASAIRNGAQNNNQNNIKIVREASNIVFDHVSAGQATDQQLLVYDKAHDITIANSLVALGLHRSTHSEALKADGSPILQDHAYGMQADTDTNPTGVWNSRLTLYRNVWMLNEQRSPWIGLDMTDMVNNVILRVGSFGLEISLRFGTRRYNIINNLVLDTTPAAIYPASIKYSDRAGSIYASGNIGSTRSAGQAEHLFFGVGLAGTTGGESFWSSTPHDTGYALETLPVNESLLDSIIETVGALPTNRDSIDADLMVKLKARSGVLIDCYGNSQVTPGNNNCELNVPVPTYGGGASKLGTGADAITNAFKDRYGISRSTDGLTATAPDGRTFFEHFMHSLNSDTAIDPSTPVVTTIDKPTPSPGGNSVLATGGFTVSFSPARDSGWQRRVIVGNSNGASDIHDSGYQANTNSFAIPSQGVENGADIYVRLSERSPAGDDWDWYYKFVKASTVATD
jgi:hypothetical protein